MAYSEERWKEISWKTQRDARKPAPTCSDAQNLANVDVTIPEDVTTGEALWDYVKDVLKENGHRIDDLCTMCRRLRNCECGHVACGDKTTSFEHTKIKLSMFVNFTN